MEQVCRACMTSSVAFVDIFTDQREPSLADMLNECVDCEIKQEDQLPKKICLACIFEVQAAFRFKRKCENSHQVLSAKLIQRRIVEVECDKMVPVKIEPTDEDIDHHNLEMEPEEFIGTEDNQREGSSTEESYADGHDESLPGGRDVNIQSELLKMENWELAEGNIDLGCVKIEEDAALSTENQHTEEDATVVEVCAEHQETYEPFDKQPYLQNESVPKRNQFQCPHCPKDFSQSSHLNAHIRTHTGERPFKCPQCPRAFSQASNLRKHLCIHSGERPFKCPHCPNAFTRHTDLQYHVSTHPGKQIHKCPHCTRYFIESAELEEHIRYHTGERTYNCTECSKEFGYAWQLQRHIRTHTGKHPFQCPHCPKSCVDKGDLGRHVRSHTGERPHKCPHCPKAFARAAYLKTHINSHSKDNP